MRGCRLSESGFGPSVTDHADAVRGGGGSCVGVGVAGRWSAAVATAGSLCDTETNDGERLNDCKRIKHSN